MDLSEIITDKLINAQIINVDEKDVYSYGFKQGLLLLLNIVTIIIIGFLFNMIWQSVVFMAAYSILRVYAGGYHATTSSRCYLFSVVMITTVLWLIKLIPWNDFISFFSIATSSIIILQMAPVEDLNKPLDWEEKIVFKKRTNIILSVLIGFALIFWLKGGKQISICIIMGVCLSSIMLVLGKIKDIRS